MRIYFSGVGGSGIGPLALLAKDCGYDVIGSDLKESPFSNRLAESGVEILIGQDGSQIEKAHKASQIDWLVYTPALPEDHPELAFARKNGIRISKSSEFINHVLNEKNLKLIAVSGTHGKSTTSAMMSWLFHSFGIPVSHLIGAEPTWGPSAMYQDGSEYLVHEADEYDRKFLDFTPYSAIVSSIEHDHIDTYPTEQDYADAFLDFIASAHCAYLWREDAVSIELNNSMPHCAHVYGVEDSLQGLTLPGDHNKQNAFLVAKAFSELFPDKSFSDIVAVLNTYPGTKRRFEKLRENIYTDYAHTPREIEATLATAKELHKDVYAVYQPHQNVRQHHIIKEGGYGIAFDDADGVYWLPTYLSREDPSQEVLSPEELAKTAKHKKIEVVEDWDKLKEIVEQASQSAAVVFMGAGDIDDWARENFAK